jgi:hypothetical protein
VLIETFEDKRFNFGCTLKKMAGPTEKVTVFWAADRRSRD